MTDARPIGVFDSGVGGLTVLRAIHDLLPHESTVYVGDLQFFPYGPRPRKQVRDRAVTIGRFLQARDVKMIVVACNTATSAALQDVTGAVEVMVEGVVEPGAAAAMAASRTKWVGVVATSGTVESQAYIKALTGLCPEVTVHQVACGELVDLIESGAKESSALLDAVKMVVERLVAGEGCDTIILGCTHFPLIRHMFEQLAPAGVSVVDSASATAVAVRGLLRDAGREAPTVEPEHTFLVSAHAGAFVAQARSLFGEHVQAEVVELDRVPALSA